MAFLKNTGTFRGTIKESTVGVTKANGYPQWVARLEAVQKYADTAEELAHYGITEAGWVDYPTEDIVGYFVLYNSDRFCPETEMFHVKDIAAALGWNPADGLTSLTDGTYVGAKIQFKTAERTYENKTRTQVQNVAAYDEAPVQELKPADPATLKLLNGKFTGYSKPVKAATAKTAATKPPKKTAAPPAAKAPEAKAAGVVEVLHGMTKDQAWEHVMNHKGERDEDVIADSWLKACETVGGDNDETTFTPAQWAQIAAKTLA